MHLDRVYTHHQHWVGPPLDLKGAAILSGMEEWLFELPQFFCRLQPALDQQGVSFHSSAAHWMFLVVSLHSEWTPESVGRENPSLIPARPRNIQTNSRATVKVSDIPFPPPSPFCEH